VNRFVRQHIVFQTREFNRPVRRLSIICFPIVFVYFFLYTPAHLALERIDLPIGLPVVVRLAAGVPVAAVGLSLYLWTLVHFARAEGTQVPVAPTTSVVSTGPYAHTRNPMQTSAVFMVVGAGLIANSWAFMLGGLVIPLAYLVYIRRVEEVELEARFGEEYIAYKRATPFLIPRFLTRAVGAMDG
jgi:protein-S-isoprenylcysteine O-methyltransferase Ste14